MTVQWRSSGRDFAAKRRVFAIIGGASALMAFTSSASAAPYNPLSLGAEPYSEVTDICQSTLGLRPSEPEGPVWGAAMNPGLTSGENHYEGCIASLSRTLRDMGSAAGQVRAADHCREQGFKPDTPALAECVLREIDGPSGQDAPVTETRIAQGVGDAKSRSFPGSFFRASNGEVRHRVQLACARLGLTPGSAASDDCVRGLMDTFFSIDNPQS